MSEDCRGEFVCFFFLYFMLVFFATSDILNISEREVSCMTTTIVKWGNSRGIRLPKPFLENLNLSDNDEVDIITENNAIIIKKSVKRQHKSIKQRLEEFHGKDIQTILKEADEGNEQPALVDWGKPVGEELW